MPDDYTAESVKGLFPHLDPSSIDETIDPASEKNQAQIYYVGKHGDDNNDGLTPAHAVLTIAKALTLAAAQTPATANRFAVVVLDAGVYTESFTAPAFVPIYAPNARIAGTVTMASDDSYVDIGQIYPLATRAFIHTGGTCGARIGNIVCPLGVHGIASSAAAGTCTVTCNAITTVTGNGIYHTGAGTLVAHCGLISTSSTGRCITHDGTGATLVTAGDVTAAANGYGIVMATGGTLDVIANRIAAVTYSWTIAAGVVNVTVNSHSGTPVITGGTFALNGLHYRELVVGHASLTEAVNGTSQALNLGAVLPNKCIVIGSEVNITTLFDGGTPVSVDIHVGGTDVDAIGVSHDVMAGSGATGRQALTAGVHPVGIFSSEQLVVTFNIDGANNLAALTVGTLTVSVWYMELYHT